mmetsp:Transcript_17885/g.51907  ORF Transcript_17885/g.51907 Transcript_17885/m.51907 type:complete len:100 (-) Transcript_17885:2242-2541(-)
MCGPGFFRLPSFSPSSVCCFFHTGRKAEKIEKLFGGPEWSWNLEMMQHLSLHTRYGRFHGSIHATGNNFLYVALTWHLLGEGTDCISDSDGVSFLLILN